MNIKVLFCTPMGRTMLLSGGFASLFPPAMVLLEHQIFRRWKWHQIRLVVLAVFTIGILFLTLINRAPSERDVMLTPFWSYVHWNEAEYRWQIYMNVFIFIPFGFMLPWALRRCLGQTVLIGLLLSIFIESAQYIFGLGLCEFDDVFHNTIGALMGGLYYRLLAAWKIKHYPDP